MSRFLDIRSYHSVSYHGISQLLLNKTSLLHAGSSRSGASYIDWAQQLTEPESIMKLRRGVVFSLTAVEDQLCDH